MFWMKINCYLICFSHYLMHFTTFSHIFFKTSVSLPNVFSAFRMSHKEISAPNEASSVTDISRLARMIAICYQVPLLSPNPSYLRRSARGKDIKKMLPWKDPFALKKKKKKKTSKEREVAEWTKSSTGVGGELTRRTGIITEVANIAHTQPLIILKWARVFFLL